MAEIKTDNSFLSDKVYLRYNHLPEKDVITVLDCYAGSGRVWKNVVSLKERKIRRLPVDFRDDFGFHLPGDNLGYLMSMNLDGFDVIDLDAYGIPYKQLKEIFKKKYKGIIFVTFIQSVYGVMPIDLLCEVGFIREMIKKTPALFNKCGWDYFLQWLAMNGVKSITHRSHARKHYLVINCAEVSS